MDRIKLSIAKSYSTMPGPRHKVEGDFSGEVFREEILEKEFSKAVSEGKILLVDLDGTIGYGTSFLEEVFGGLARKFGKENVENHIEIKSEEESYLIDDIYEYIRHAEDS